MPTIQTIDWAVVMATLVGPIIAVAITLWYQGYSLRRMSRMSLFASMMRLRKNPLDTEFVGSLNMVPIHFFGKPRVMERYSQLMAVFEDNGWGSSDSAVVSRLTEKTDLHIAYLLSAMSVAVRTPIEQLHILRGAYSPKGWADERQKNDELREAFLKVLTGKSIIPVMVIPTPDVPAEASEPPAPTPPATSKPSKK